MPETYKKHRSGVLDMLELENRMIWIGQVKFTTQFSGICVVDDDEWISRSEWFHRTLWLTVTTLFTWTTDVCKRRCWVLLSWKCTKSRRVLLPPEILSWQCLVSCVGSCCCGWMWMITWLMSSFMCRLFISNQSHRNVCGRTTCCQNRFFQPRIQALWYEAGVIVACNVCGWHTLYWVAILLIFNPTEQRPRKLQINGSNGVEYRFLLKGYDGYQPSHHQEHIHQQFNPNSFRYECQ